MKIIPRCIQRQNENHVAGERAQKLRTLAALSRGPGFDFQHYVDSGSQQSETQGDLASFPDLYALQACDSQTYMKAKHSYTSNKNK